MVSGSSGRKGRAAKHAASSALRATARQVTVERAPKHPHGAPALPRKIALTRVAAKIAVSRFGSATDLSVKMALAKVGLNAEKDVTLLQIGAQTESVTVTTEASLLE